ncbi:MAG: Crp/Fnr family transcriptional regulator [Thermodesulfovibrionales bacterium]
MDIEKVLRQSEFFKGIADDNLRALAYISIPKKLERKKTIFLEGQEGHSIFLLVHGAVKLYKTSPVGKEVVIKIIYPGEIFGEVILFEKENYPVTAQTLRDSLILMLPKFQIHCLLNIERFRNDFISMLMKKQRHLADRILYLTANDVEERFFLFLEEQYGRKNEYIINMSKKNIASVIGTNPETLSRLILRLKKEKKILWEDKKLTLKPGFWNNWKH